MVWEHLGLWCFSLWPGWAAANAVSMGRFAPTLMGHSGSSGYMEGGAGPGQSDEQSPVWDGWGTLRQLPGDAVTPPPGTVTLPAIGMRMQAARVSPFKGCRLLGHRPTSPAACRARPAPPTMVCHTDPPQPAEPALWPVGPCTGISDGSGRAMCTHKGQPSGRWCCGG